MTITRRAGVVAPVATPALEQVTRQRVSVVIPALNEARNLEHVFAALPAGLHEVIVVDGIRSTARRKSPASCCPASA